MKSFQSVAEFALVFPGEDQDHLSFLPCENALGQISFETLHIEIAKISKGTLSQMRASRSG
jgi:hypothetical protein